MPLADLQRQPFEMTEDMSPAERGIVMQGGNDTLDAYRQAGRSGAPGAVFGLGRPGLSDPVLGAMDRLSFLMGAVPGLQSNIAAKAGLLPTSAAAAPAAGGALAKQASNAAALAAQQSRLSGLQMLLQQASRAVQP